MITDNGPIRVSAAGLELWGHGTGAFPCGCYLSDPSVSEVPWHWHDEMEFVHFRKGEMRYLAGGERFVGRPGDGVFVNGGVPHSELSVEGKPSVEGSLTCHPRLLYGSEDGVLYTRYLRHLLDPTAPQVVRLRHDGEAWEREAVALIRRAWEAVAHESEFFEQTCRECLTRVCLLVWRHAAPHPTGAEGSSNRLTARIKDMIGFVESHYAEDLTIAQIAKAGGVSEREAQREFGRMVGERPLTYLRNHRLFVASQLLRSTDMTVSEVAHACGFAGAGYFAHRFRERYGHAPTEHRLR